MVTTAASSLDSDTQQIVENLIQINIDSRDGYRNAARYIQHSETRTALRNVAGRRAGNAHALRDVLETYHCEVTEQGSFLARMHRVWVALRATVSKETQAILTEAVAAEDYVRLQYGDGLKQIRGRGLRQLLREQLQKLTEDAARLQQLLQQASADASIEQDLSAKDLP